MATAPQSIGRPVSSWLTVIRENEFHFSKAIVSLCSILSFTIVGRMLSVTLLANARMAKQAHTA